MEALAQNFVEEDISHNINTNIAKAESTNAESTNAMSSCWVLIDPNSKRNVTNTDIVLCINEHHKALDDDQEVGVKIQHLGEEVTFYIDHIAHQNQSMIYFKGHTEDGRLVHFVKHSSELKIELQPLQRRVSDAPKAPFGFADWDAYEKVKLQYS